MAGSFFATSARREERRVSADTQALSNDADTAKNASPEGSAGFGQFLRHSSSTYRKDTPSSSFLEPGANPALPLASYYEDRTLELAFSDELSENAVSNCLPPSSMECDVCNEEICSDCGGCACAGNGCSCSAAGDDDIQE